mgnify:CR=1 FL=1
MSRRSLASTAALAVGVVALLAQTSAGGQTQSAAPKPTAVQLATLASGSTPDLYSTVCWGLGLTASGDEWIVHSTKDGDRGAIVVYQRAGGGGAGIIVSAPGATAFLPAGALDAQGRLHVVWYDTSGAQGKLVYRRSVTNNLLGLYTPPVVLDDNATPGDRWYPFFDSAMGGRRLREYIDIAADGDRVHVAWAHAPTAPSRVHTRWIAAD